MLAPVLRECRTDLRHLSTCDIDAALRALLTYLSTSYSVACTTKNVIHGGGRRRGMPPTKVLDLGCVVPRSRPQGADTTPHRCHERRDLADELLSAVDVFVPAWEGVARRAQDLIDDARWLGVDVREHGARQRIAMRDDPSRPSQLHS